MRFSIIPFLILALPLIEIAVFVVVGSQIGVLATIGAVIATAFLGVILLRIQGFGVLDRIRRRMDAGEAPGRDLVDGVMIMIAGVLLLIPGFVTDILGLLLFIPAVREFGWSLIKGRIVVATPDGRPYPGSRNRQHRIIDLDSDDYSRRD